MVTDLTAPVGVTRGITDAANAVRNVVRQAPTAAPVRGLVPDAAVVAPVLAVRVEHWIVIIRYDFDAWAHLDQARGAVDCEAAAAAIHDAGLFAVTACQ